MSAGWQVGDLALCIKKGRWTDHNLPPNAECGCVYRVKEVDLEPDGIYLVLHDLDVCANGTEQSFSALHFRKIKPDTEAANADDAAWLKDLLAKPKVPALAFINDAPSVEDVIDAALAVSDERRAAA